ncbi:1-phosphofructokinase [Geosporobacter ferrireducens]|uniref:Tagatose-6-phosphate kinase n=1 Tax=Geosporobacter ferrireducens TaxID=1424294 RepID=A0A1D8GD80_9FIRM|nr:1-phosphofructokinase [Geosporobacter ferrireducens]AOT68863.1 1-phosphofructokinase [Geosporobacter ferrireducens]MTI54904.1 1-phosphofructokinase [Geosporobacter ferrireducens]
MIATITLNAAIDKTIEIDSFTPGSVNRVLKSHMEPGGKGINVSKVVKALGGSTIALGFVGGDSGKWIDESLSALEIETDFVLINQETRTNIKIIDTAKKQITDINDQGKEVEEIWVERLYDKVRLWAEASNVMVFSGSLLPNISSDIYQKLIQIAKEKGCKTILDADGQALLDGAKAAPYMVKPNIHELENTFGVKLKNEQDIIKCCQFFLEQGIGIVVISMGAEGALMITKDGAWKTEKIKVAVKNTVGAGDSMVGAFAYGIDKGYAPVEILSLAVATATVHVEQGTVFSQYSVIEQYKKRVKILEIR